MLECKILPLNKTFKLWRNGRDFDVVSDLTKHAFNCKVRTKRGKKKELLHKRASYGS